VSLVHEVPLRPCPQCGHHIDRAGPIPGAMFDPEAPRNGDFTICGYCLAVLRFAPGGTYLLMTPEAIAALPSYVRDWLVQAVIYARGMIRGPEPGKRH
jgi:hypothetical protein